MTDGAIEESVRAHFVIWVNPFFYDAGAVGPHGLTVGRWRPWFERYGHASGARFIDDVGFFIPQVARFLFPETRTTDPLPTNDSDWREWCIKAHARLSADDALGTVRRLTFAPLLAGPQAARLYNDYGDGVSISIEWADVWLFPMGVAGAKFSKDGGGVGFLAMKVRLAETATLERLRSLQSLGRWVHPPVVGKQSAQIAVGDRQGVALRDAIDGLVQEFLGAPSAESLSLGDPLPTNARSATTTELGMAYGLIQRTMLFTVIGDPAIPPTTPFRDRREQLLFELTTGQKAEGDWTPAEALLDKLRKDQTLEYWDGWSALALWDNITVVGGASEFVEKWTAANFEGDYLHLWLVSLFEFLRLESLSRQIVVHSADLEATYEDLKSASDALLEFRNQYQFTDVTIQPLGQQLCGVLRHALQIRARGDAVAFELESMRTRYSERVRERTEVLLGHLNIGLVPATVCGSAASVFALAGKGMVAALLLGLALSMVLLRIGQVTRFLTGDKRPAKR